MGSKRALVTGGAGFIGSHLVDLLVERGYEVTILDNLESQTHLRGKPQWVNPNARFIEGDVRDETSVEKALQGVHWLFHLAAFGGFTQEISKYIDVNVRGTGRIFEKIGTGKFSIEKVMVASSQAIYGEGAYRCRQDGFQFPPSRSIGALQKKQWEPLCPRCGCSLEPVLVSEEKPCDSQTAYALSKEFEERLALLHGRHFNLPVVALRFGVTYGPRQSLFNPYTGVVSIFSTRLLNDQPPQVYEDGRQKRDFVYVGDVARATLFVMEKEAADFQAFNVGTGQATTVAELARHLATIYQKSLEPRIPGEFRVGDVRHILLDPTKLSRLGFHATTSLEKGLSFFAEWMKSQSRVEEYFTQAYGTLKKLRIVRS